MNKNEFLDQLEQALAPLPDSDIDHILIDYEAFIDEKTESGISEEEAVASLGSPSEAAAELIAEAPPVRLLIGKIKTPNRYLNTAILVLGFPLWFAALALFGTAVMAVFAVIWGIVVVLTAAVIALFVAAVVGFIGYILYAVKFGPEYSKLFLGFSLTAAGLGIVFHVCFGWISHQLVELTGKLAVTISGLFRRAE